jgi:glutaminase
MFGSTESVLKHVLDALLDGDYFILDLKHVFEIDRAACQLLSKLKEAVWAQGKTLLFTHTEEKYAFTRHLKRDSAGQDDDKLFAFADTDHALEWCEDNLLKRHGQYLSQTGRVQLADQDLCAGLEPADLQQLETFAKTIIYEPGETIFRCGDEADSLYLIVEGEVEVLLPTDAGRRKRLALLSPGRSFGEMALLNHRTRSADVRTTCRSQFHRIVFDEIPEGIRIKLVTNFAQQLARKLGRDTRELQHLD